MPADIETVQSHITIYLYFEREACAPMFDYYTLRSGFLTREAAQEYADTLPPEAKAKVGPYKVTQQYVQPSRRIRITFFAVNVCRWFIPAVEER